MGNFMLGFEKSCLNNVRYACRYFPGHCVKAIFLKFREWDTNSNIGTPEGLYRSMRDEIFVCNKIYSETNSHQV